MTLVWTPRLLRVTLALCVCVCLGVLLGACSRGPDPETMAPQLRSAAATRPSWVADTPLGRRLWTIEQAFYEARGYRPAWTDRGRETPDMRALLEQLRRSTDHGLDPADYDVASVESLRSRSSSRFSGVRFRDEDVPQLDLRLTHAWLQYAADLLAWGAPARQVYVNWLVEPKQEDLAARLASALDGGGIDESLEGLAPTHPQYTGLQAALRREREHPTGKSDVLRMNLERWRWEPRNLGERYVLVNVPAYQMQLIEGDQPALAMRVIVGASDTPTPLFSDEMTYVVFSPYWNIPEQIMRDEALPKVRRDPEYLARNNIEVVPAKGTDPIDASTVDWDDEDAVKAVRFRQAPGPENALGLVKFIFPNHFNVYLHDTPADGLFEKMSRALSHGCIRVEDPVALAREVLRDQPSWDEPRIVTAMNGKEEHTVTLKEKLPVHIGYWTTWVAPDGTVSYTDDPYGIDKAHARLWAGRPRPVRGAPTAGV